MKGSPINKFLYQLGTFTEEIKEFTSLPQSSFKAYQSFFKEKMNGTYSDLLKEGFFYKEGEKIGKTFAPSDAALRSITEFFETQKEFYKLFIPLIQREIKASNNISEELAKDLAEWEAKLNEDISTSEISLKKKEIEDLKQSLKSTEEHDYERELKRLHYEYLKDARLSLSHIHNKLSEVKEENAVTQTRKHLLKELASIITDRSISWDEKIPQSKERIENSATLISEIRDYQDKVKEFYEENLNKHINIQKQITNHIEQGQTAVKTFFDTDKVSSHLQIYITFIFMTLSLFTEIYIVESITSTTLAIQDGPLKWLFVLGYPIAIGMAIKLNIQFAKKEEKEGTKLSITRWAITFCILGIILVGFLNAFDTPTNTAPTIDLDGDETQGLNNNPYLVLKALTLASFSIFFGIISGLLFISFFDQFERFILVRKSIIPGMRRWVINRRIKNLMKEIDNIRNTRNKLKAEVLQMGKYHDEKPLTIDYENWLDKLKASAKANFESGYQIGLTEYRDKDELDIVEANVKVELIEKGRKIFKKYYTHENGQATSKVSNQN